MSGLRVGREVPGQGAFRHGLSSLRGRACWKRLHHVVRKRPVLDADDVTPTGMKSKGEITVELKPFKCLKCGYEVDAGTSFTGRHPAPGQFTVCIECARSEEHTSELQSRGLISYAVFCLKK